MANVLAKTWPWTAPALAVTSAVAQLVVSGTGGRVVLVIILIAAVGDMALTQARSLAARRSGLRARLSESEAEVDHLRKVLLRTLNYSASEVIERRVEIHIEVGADSTADKIIERHWTYIRPSLLYRQIKPITRTGDSKPVLFHELRLEVETGHPNLDVATVLLSESTSGVVVLFVFQPETSDEIEFQVSYCSPRLLDPLRDGEVDYITWAPTNEHRLGQPVTVKEVLFYFTFPVGTKDFLVRETNGSGAMADSELLPSQQRRAVWRDDAPTGAGYSFELFKR